MRCLTPWFRRAGVAEGHEGNLEAQRFEASAATTCYVRRLRFCS